MRAPNDGNTSFAISLFAFALSLTLWLSYLGAPAIKDLTSVRAKFYWEYQPLFASVLLAALVYFAWRSLSLQFDSIRKQIDSLGQQIGNSNPDLTQDDSASNVRK